MKSWRELMEMDEEAAYHERNDALAAARAEGRAEGYAEGCAVGRAVGRTEQIANMTEMELASSGALVAALKIGEHAAATRAVLLCLKACDEDSAIADVATDDDTRGYYGGVAAQAMELAETIAADAGLDMDSIGTAHYRAQQVARESAPR